MAFHPDISQIRVQAEPGAVNSFQAAVESTLRTQHDLTSTEQDDFQIVNASSIASAVSSTTKTLTRLMAAIAAISLIVGGIGVANVMLVTVRERTREIGVRRAVGRDAAQHRRAVPGLRHRHQPDRRRARPGRGHRRRLHRRLGAQRLAGVLGDHGGLALVVAAAVGILAGIGPAVQAASVEPTDALRYE